MWSLYTLFNASRDNAEYWLKNRWAFKKIFKYKNRKRLGNVSLSMDEAK